MARPRFKVLVCRGPECGDRHHSRGLYDRFREVLQERGIAGDVELGWQSCFGRCSQGPNCLVRQLSAAPEPQRFVFAALPSRSGVTALYNGVTRDDIAELTDQHIIGGQVVRRLVRRPELGASSRRQTGRAPGNGPPATDTPETSE